MPPRRTAVFALLVLSTFATLASGQAALPAGRWVGEYQVGADKTFLAIRIEEKDHHLTGSYSRPTVFSADDGDLQDLQVAGNAVSFSLGDANTRVTVQATWSPQRIEGKVQSHGAGGAIMLLPLASLSHAYLDTLAGDYQLPGGKLIVIARENNFIVFLDHRTRRTARLMPESDTHFWTGPSLDIWYPKENAVTFIKNAAGEVTSLRLETPDRTPVVARRVTLYREEDVEFHNGEVKLAGTLRIPPGKRRWPAVVLLAGSNYQPRGGQNAFEALVADQFARHGFAALVFDKRGTGESSGEADDNYDLRSGDAATGIQLLRSRPDIDPNRIGLWGLSQGGQIAPIVAAKAGNIAFLINLSGSVVNSNEQEIERTELTLRADGFSEADIHDAVALQKLKFHYACKRDNWDEYKRALDAAQGKAWLPDPYIGPPDTQQSTAWDFWKCGVEPAQYWESVTAPVLYIYGEHENYSDPRINVPRFEHAMAKAGNHHYIFKLIPGAEHAMTEAKRGGEKELPHANTYVRGFFELMTDWAKQALAMH